MSRLAAVALSLAALHGASCYVVRDSRPVGGYEPAGDWVVSGDQAAELHAQGALFLDARSRSAFETEHVEGALSVSWGEYSEPEEPLRGLLLEDDEELGRRLRALGVSAARPVVVVGEPVGGWGEDGRVSWMLRALGHPRAAFVDGGLDALAAAGATLTAVDSGDPTPGDFEVSRDPTLTVDMEELRALLESGGPAVLVDTRERREFDGETPYGESRGGHLPGAVHLHYEELLGAEGRLLPRQDIFAALAERGVTPEDEVIAYCTGGVRSGWLVAVLRDLGFSDVRNFAGSMWQWAAEDPSTHPLE